MELYTNLVDIDEIVQFFENNQEALRIKKLIFYTSRDYWENDSNVLNNISLKDLIIELHKANESPEELSKSLYQAVESLNRQELYAKIANLIIAKLGKLYEDSGESTEILLVKPKIKSTFTDTNIVRIVDNLETHIYADRIKKLIYYICKESWENDINIIDSYNLRELILELRQQYPTLELLKKALFDLVETLNRQNLYTLVAQAIIKEIKILYVPDYKQTQVIENVDNISLELNGNSNFKEKNEEEQDKETPQDNQAQEEENLKRNYEPFEVRVDLMQYTNPLRAKLLLFSLLYHKFDDTEKDWSMLKTCTLDDLLSKLFHAYKSIKALESDIYFTAESLVDCESYEQSASVIVKSLMSFYED